MAVWQFDLDFEHADDGRDLSAVTTELLMVQLARSVGPSKAMMKDWRFFGDKDSNRVDVVMDPDGSSQVQARLDARASDTDQFIKQVCSAAAAAKCTLFSDELGLTLDPDPKDVRAALQRSVAWRYSLDPGAFRP